MHGNFSENFSVYSLQWLSSVGGLDPRPLHFYCLFLHRNFKKKSKFCVHSYRLPTKVREGSVFAGLCQTFCPWGDGEG